MKRHAFDPISFVFGLLFAFLAVFVLTGNTLGDLWPTWALTLPAMTVGLLVVAYAVRRLLSASATEGSTDVVTDHDDSRSA
jgi:hypothetical protein